MSHDAMLRGLIFAAMAVTRGACSLVHPESIASKAPLSEDGYQSVVSLRDDNAMKMFTRRVLGTFDREILDESKLSGFVPHYSGTIASQSFAGMVSELFDVPWASHAPVQVRSNLSHAHAKIYDLRQMAKSWPMNTSNSSFKNSTVERQNATYQAPNGTSHNGGNIVDSLSKLAGDSDAYGSSQGSVHPQRSLPPAMASIRKAESAESIARDRLAKKAKDLQNSRRVTSEAQKKVQAATHKVEDLRAEQASISKVFHMAKKEEKMAKKRSEQLSHKSDRQAAVLAAKAARTAELNRAKAERASSVVAVRLQNAVASEKKMKGQAAKRMKEENAVIRKQTKAQEVLQKRRKSTATETQKMRKQALTISRLQGKEAKLKAAYQRAGDLLRETQKLRAETMKKYNISAATTVKILAQMEGTREVRHTKDAKDSSHTGHKSKHGNVRH